ncbi:hypothetical protein [Marinicella meishanensis]|uniref:hypothetical protein n=1 Tax=Marinicella meishanensis TaxID=2873263 RepID=UPI001CBC9D84|nr:hypothetical protein [Marinicella sp. NBU2979]
MKPVMKYAVNWLMFLLLSGMAVTSQAVSVASNGVGGVLIYPYYTVNNDLNFLYSVVNTSSHTKAVKIRFLEGDIGLDVLTFNVYLGAYDVWTGALVPTTSTIDEHLGEASVLHVSGDTSCAPFLNKGGQQFLPFVIDTDLDPDNRDMSRSREGYLEVYEMANLVTPQAVQMIDHSNRGVPTNCAGLENVWQAGSWVLGPDEDPSGDLLGSASLVNVNEGLAFHYDALALKNFGLTAENHTEPSAALPDLDSAVPESTVLLPDGQLIQAEWTHGFQAVSAVLTQAQVGNEFNLETVLNANTEWVMTSPTRKFHTNSGDLALLPPFLAPWQGNDLTSCDRYRVEMWDRETRYEDGIPNGGVLPPPGGIYPKLCQAITVMEFIYNAPTHFDRTAVLGSRNHMNRYAAIPGGDWLPSGAGRVHFLDAEPAVPISGAGLQGLPVTGFAVMQFTNAGAAEGLLAQYGSLFKHLGQQTLAATETTP